MQIRTCLFSLGGVFLCGLLPVAAQEVTVLDVRPWSPTLGFEWGDPPFPSDRLWIDHTTLLQERKTPGVAGKITLIPLTFTAPGPLKELGAEWLLPVLDSADKLDATANPAAPEKAQDKLEAPEKIKPDASANSPSQIYLQGHLRLTDALELEGKGDFAGAFFKFREARDLFDSVHEADRLWNPEIVEYRRRKVREDMERVRSAETRRRAEGATPKQEKQLKQEKREKEKKTNPGVPGKKENPEMEALRQQLRDKEQALQQARQREAALRAVLRDLLNEMEAPARKRADDRPLLPPLSEAPWKFAPPLLPSHPPSAPSVQPPPH